MKNYKEHLKNITTFIFDVDGVLTDGRVFVTTEGEQYRNMNIKDGYALQLAVKKGYHVAIISGGNNEGVRVRLKGLGLTDIYLGQRHKMDAFEDLKAIYGLEADEILYMGDDIPDFEVMSQCGLATCPADAAPEIQKISDYVSPRGGGQGCARDVLEQVMKVQGKWMNGDGFEW
ncbi:HAD-IIIA family hydrolase [Cryomorphaceae bacterium]|nr:HAD-IIIA family hydrolase [Cryomorphaceae bacterium]